ncbi:hypothetical protein PMAYCL1PPCAC_27590, partial [Pristionchus mayeri]
FRQMLLLFSIVCSTLGSSYNFLVYNPQFGNSHVNFVSRLADALIEQGHDVVMVSPRIDTLVGSPKTKARVIETDQSTEAAEFQERMNSAKGGMLSTVWQSTDVFTQRDKLRPFYANLVKQCRWTLADRELIYLLRKEHFDAAFTEHYDSCGYVLFHLLGVEKFATVNSMAIYDGLFGVTQLPVNPSYIPTYMGDSAGARMTFLDRLLNTLAFLKMNSFFEHHLDMYQALLDQTFCYQLNIREIMANTSLVFLNSDPLADFPKLTSPRVIDIGGISVHSGHNQLDEYWMSILNARNHTIFISFGTLMKSHLMPAAFKETIVATVNKFPNVTFIWKYEKPEQNISDGIDNLVEVTWAPQHDLLHDDRLTAFITHGGQGSITEAAGAGIPLICIPVTSDQFRNSRQAERNGVGIMIRKEDLGRMGPLEEAIERVLKDKSFNSNAVTLANMIAERPFNMKDVFVRNMEFMTKFGPHRRFDHYGAQLTFAQYYLIDVFAFLALLVISAVFLSLHSLKIVAGYMSGYFVVKKLKSN